ncbi:MAG: DUF6702 family protein [Bacteroidota bacterium]
MKAKFLVIAIIFTISSGFNISHPLKMSFSNLVISWDGNVELETRIFLDDITGHMQNLYGIKQVDFTNITSNGTQALQRYFLNHFYFEQDGQKLNLSIKSVSLSKNLLSLVVKMQTMQRLDSSKDVYLVNTLLCDAFPKQGNDVKYQGEHLSLNIENPKVKIQID